MASKTWQEIAESMQKHRADTIAAVQPAVPDPPTNLPLNVTGIPKELLSEEVVSITEKPPEQLISDLASGKLTSTAVTEAFLQRAGLSSKLVNCCTELLPETALDRAKYLDEYYSKNKKPIGPLHGKDVLGLVSRETFANQNQLIPRPANISQGACWDEGSRLECWIRRVGWKYLS